MTPQERNLQLALRIVGTVALGAIVGVVMPYSLMNYGHQMMGLGEMPGEPVVGYLVRSLSLLYLFDGALMWLASTDIRRFLPIAVFEGVFHVVLGLTLLAVDLYEGLPWFWALGEGFFDTAVGVVFLLLCRAAARSRPTGADAGV